MIKKSTLSTKSKVFVVSNRKKSSENIKQHNSSENVCENTENSMVICNLNDSFDSFILRKMAAEVKDDECGSECSYQSASTNGSIRRYEQHDSSSERSDDSCNSRSTESISDKGIYNNFDQKHPIRNPVFQIKQSNTGFNMEEGTQLTENSEASANEASPVRHKKTRRGGKKNRAQNKLKEAEKSTSDKVQSFNINWKKTK